MPATNNRRIAKNAMLLYVRMGISMLVSLYTSRVVLRVLGVEDFGIYGVVGGVVALLEFLNASMSGATSRFITFELGKGNIEKLKKVFSSSLLIHIGIAVVIFVVGETLGLWFVTNKLIIPEERMFAALCVFQISIVTSAINITQVPYSACIIAHEKMDVYAYAEILRVVLKLLIVYLLEYILFDKLILYAILTFSVTLILTTIYKFYCVKHFTESHFRFVYDRKILNPMLKFSGWDLYGNICGTIKQQGTTIILNLFYGPIVNAAANIASTVIGALSSLSSSTTTAFRPQMIKQYAQSDFAILQLLIKRSIGATSFLLSVCAFPVVAEMHLIMMTWLGQVPEHAVALTRIAIFNSLIGNVNAIILTPIHATGNVKNISIIGGTAYLLNIVFLYFLLSFVSLPPLWVYLINCIIMFVILVADSLILNHQIPQINSIKIWTQAILPIVLISVLLYILCNYIVNNMEEGLLRFVLMFVLTFLVSVLLYFSLVFDKDIRLFLLNKFKFLFYKVKS